MTFVLALLAVATVSMVVDLIYTFITTPEKMMRNVNSKYDINDAAEYSPMYHNQPMAIFDKQGNQLTILGAGTMDSVELFEDDGALFIYSANDNLGYMGLEIIDLNDNQPIGEIFLQCEDDYNGYSKYTPINRVKQMAQHIF